MARAAVGSLSSRCHAALLWQAPISRLAPAYCGGPLTALAPRALMRSTLFVASPLGGHPVEVDSVLHHLGFRGSY